MKTPPLPWLVLRLAIVLSSANLVHAGTFVPPANNRVTINFNADWLYIQGDVSNAQAATFNDSAWLSVGLPHSTTFPTVESPLAYTGVSWYRKHFTVTNAYAGRKIFIEFGAAMQLADVWVNGSQVTLNGPQAPDHIGGYLPFTVDVTGLVNYGGSDNAIAVRIDSTPNSNWAPGWAGIDFQYYGGLYRDVKMDVTDLLHVTDAVYANEVAGGGIFVTYPSVSASTATVNAQTEVFNENTVAETATLISTLTDANTNIVQTASNTVSIPAGARQMFNQSLIVASPSLWHPYSPYLYTLNTVIQKGPTTVDYLTTRIGIRNIQWTHDNGLLINGTRFYALGADFHQSIYGEGNAMPDRTAYYDVQRLKNAGFDFVRSSHYPHSPAFYDACDQLGVLVMDSIPGWQFYNNSTEFNEATVQDTEDMIRRDRNHPSIVLWETSLNESSFTSAWASNEQAIAHAEYPGSEMFTSGWITTNFDTLCSSEQAGVRSSTDTRPIIIDEYGDWDYGGNNSTSRVAREDPDTNLLVQCANHEGSLNADLALNWYSADALWVFADYAGYNPTVTLAGIMDYYRLPKFNYYFYQAQRNPSISISNVQTGPMVYIANTRQAASPTAMTVFCNCQQVSLYTNGILFATQSPDTNYPYVPHAPFTFNLSNTVNGPIRADGIINGAVACSTTRLLAGSPTQIILAAEGMDYLNADGGDARLIFVSVVDTNGQVVPNATNTVNLSLSGYGQILGPTTIQLKGGELSTWIQAGRVAGLMTLTASGPGLSPDSLTLTNQTVPNIDPLPAPATPTGLTAAAGTSSVTLNWNPAQFAFTYNVKCATVSGGPYTALASNILTTNYTVATNGTTYYYVVSAANEAGVESGNSAEATSPPPLPATVLINALFELPGTGKITTGFATVPGWMDTGTNYSDTGLQEYNGGFNSDPWEAYEQSSDDGAYQIVNYRIQSGDQFTLTWWARGEWNGSSSAFSGSGHNDPEQTVALLGANATNQAFPGANILATTTNGLPGQTAWIQYTLAYTGGAANVGDYIGVSFVTSRNKGDSSGSYAGYDGFDLAIISIPSYPRGLTADPGNGQVSLSWNSVPNAIGYYLKRSLVPAGPYTTIVTNVTSLSATDSGLSNGTAYYYVVSAFNQAGQGSNSGPVSATPLPPLPTAPQGLTEQVSNGQVWLSWQSAAFATGYNVFRSLIPGGFDTILANNLGLTNYVDVSAASGLTYYYSVAATNMGGQSAFSGQVSATVPPPAFGEIRMSGTNLSVAGTNGTAGSNYFLLMSSNLLSPITNWTVLLTNTFGPGGGLNLTIPLNPASSSEFYRLKLP